MSFIITGYRGFQIEFKNGYKVSVQFGPANYCEHYNDDMFSFLENPPRYHSSADAEVAVIYKDDCLIEYPDFEGDIVKGYCSPEYVLELMNWAASREG